MADAFAHSAVSLARILGSIPGIPGPCRRFPPRLRSWIERTRSQPPRVVRDPIPVHTFTSKFDLFIAHLVPRGGSVEGGTGVRCGPFSSGRAREIFDGFIEFLGMAAGNPDAPAFGRPVTGVESRPRLPDLLASGNIMNLVEEFPGRFPGNRDPGAFGTMSREELRRGYDRIAAAVLARGVRPGIPWPVCQPISQQVAARSWGSSRRAPPGMPVDPSYPAERRKWMLEDARPRLVIADRAHAGLFEGTDIPVLVLEDLDPSSNSACPRLSAGPEISVPPVHQWQLRTSQRCGDAHRAWSTWCSGSAGRRS